METLTQEQQNFHPSNPTLKAAALKSFEKLNGVKSEEFESFLTKLNANDAVAPIGTKASLIFGAIYGTVTVQPTEDPYKKWVFDHSFWGIGAVGGTSIGIMYTAYTSWDAFFKYTTAFHVQSYAEGGGILQVNFFNKDGVPVGQFNGAMAGAGAVEGGNAGTWKKS